MTHSLKMAARGPQNGQQCLEMALTLGFWRSSQLLQNNFFDPRSWSMRKGCNAKRSCQKKKSKESMKEIKVTT